MKQMPPSPGVVGEFNRMLFGEPDPRAIKRQRRLTTIRYARYLLAEVALMFAIVFALGVFVFGLIWLMGGAA